MAMIEIWKKHNLLGNEIKQIEEHGLQFIKRDDFNLYTYKEIMSGSGDVPIAVELSNFANIYGDQYLLLISKGTGAGRKLQKIGFSPCGTEFK